MFRREVNQSSPLRVLEHSIHGGLGPGNLGVVSARAGVGKTAFVVQVGLDLAMRERSVLHVALGQPLDDVLGWYDACFDDLARHTRLENPHAAHDVVARHRIIQAFADRALPPARLRRVIDLYSEGADFAPAALIIDGYDWEAAGDHQRILSAYKDLARTLGAELWLTAKTHREAMTPHPTELVPPCDAFAALIDVGLFLEPVGQHVSVRLLQDHGHSGAAVLPLRLDPDTMRFSAADTEPARLPRRAYTLLSGGARGAEAAFGEEAEHYGVAECNFTYAGREMTRCVNPVELTEAELEAGGVSLRYIESHLHRSFPDTPDFQRILQSIWHHVASAAQAFIIGEIQADDTVKGGTGWGAELARRLGKELYVFDGERGGWHRWHDDAWRPCDPPRITRRRFCGGGTRNLTPRDRNAIAALFAASFPD